MAWAWGASRLVDVLQASGGAVIDAKKLGVTGCSRNGKGAFTIGVFDERIALTIPHETSTGGVPAYRIVDQLDTERTDHNYLRSQLAQQRLRALRLRRRDFERGEVADRHPRARWHDRSARLAGPR